ncbi:hypothetical protein COO60DRAFT_634664 [Scenedesmus sp. NREL 46B-D3]|nr:hypothetical protein COO60DRAFT_634664 [Scenedesmus sp. NREL 46B-D3]
MAQAPAAVACLLCLGMHQGGCTSSQQLVTCCTSTIQVTVAAVNTITDWSSAWFGTKSSLYAGCRAQHLGSLHLQPQLVVQYLKLTFLLEQRCTAARQQLAASPHNDTFPKGSWAIRAIPTPATLLLLLLPLLLPSGAGAPVTAFTSHLLRSNSTQLAVGLQQGTVLLLEVGHESARWVESTCHT